MKKMIVPDFGKMSAAELDNLRQIVHSLSFVDRDLKALVICSCDRKTDAAGLTGRMARVMAAEGKRVLILRALLQDPSAVSEEMGLTHYLAGLCGMEDILHETDAAGVSLIPAGACSANPEMLMSGDELQHLIDACKARFDWLLIEAAPLTRQDASALHAAACSDGAIFAVKDHATVSRQLKTARKAVEQTGCPIIGCIVLDAKRPKAYA